MNNFKSPGFEAPPLRRLLHSGTVSLLGLGVAVGSGIFRTPGLVAAQLSSPWLILAAWLVGGLFVLGTSLVTSELATRFPQAGGEYVYLREAYGTWAALSFGWLYTIFVVGGGAGTIASAFGEAAVSLLAQPEAYGPLWAVGAIAFTVLVNATGLRTGSRIQNLLTLLKISAVVGISVVAVASATPQAVATTHAAADARPALFTAVFLPILWTYQGSTDTAKMAEEISDVSRALPRALISSAVTLIVLYVAVNASFLYALGPAAMAESKFVATTAVEVALGTHASRIVTAVSLLVFLSALSATVLATVRVTFAMARDGLAFRALSSMSESQAPRAALLFGGGLAALFATFRQFEQILEIYYLAACVLFSLAYASLFVFRRRDTHRDPAIFHCPFGRTIAAVLIAVQIGIAAQILSGWAS